MQSGRLVGLCAITEVWCSREGGQIMQGVTEEGLPTLCLQCRKLEKPLKQTQGPSFLLRGGCVPACPVLGRVQIW